MCFKRSTLRPKLLKLKVFWGVAPRTLVEGAASIFREERFFHEDKMLVPLPDCTASHPVIFIFPDVKKP
jgi:hypothetical protein